MTLGSWVNSLQGPVPGVLPRVKGGWGLSFILDASCQFQASFPKEGPSRGQLSPGLDGNPGWAHRPRDVTVTSFCSLGGIRIGLVLDHAKCLSQPPVPSDRCDCSKEKSTLGSQREKQRDGAIPSS